MADIAAAENLFLVDWCSFTLLDDDYDCYYVLHELGLGLLPFQDLKGMHGYQNRMYFDGISIHYNGSCPGVWVEMSGQGCRRFEESSSFFSWIEFFKWIIKHINYNITRIDIAFDDHTGLLPLTTMISDARAGNIVTKFRSGKVEEGILDDTGKTLYIGSPRSKLYIRVYDKAAERHADGHWIRFEVQLRDDRALEFARHYISHNDDLSVSFLGLIRQYLRFVVPNDKDCNKSRWKDSQYWSEFISGAEKVKVFSNPGTEYNLDRLDHYTVYLAGSAVDAAIQIHGIDRYIEMLKNRPSAVRPNPKYKELVDLYTSPSV